MPRFLRDIGLIFSAILLFSTIVLAAEEITITTYYPSPYGSYSSLQTDKLGVGDNDGDGSLTSADVPATTGYVWIKGLVGIGTTTPPSGQQLEVNGNVKALAFIATVSGAGAYKYNTSSNMTVPDYVFEKNYKLMSLDELRKYVLTNKHLPGVFSSEELKNAGMASLVEQNFKNLEKIEELVLYILQLKSENDALKVRIEKMEAKLNVRQ